MNKQGIPSVTNVVISRKEISLSLQGQLKNWNYTLTLANCSSQGAVAQRWTGSELKGRYTDRWGEVEKNLFLWFPKEKKSYFVGKATAEALEEYLPLARWQIQIKIGFYTLLGDRSNMLSMKVLWVEWWWKSACLSLICKRVKKPLMVVLQIFIDFSCSVLCFFLLLMKYAVKGALLNTVSASAVWETCRILNVLRLNFITLKLHRDICEPYCALIWNEPRKVLLLLWDWNFSLYGTLKELLNARVQSDFANVNFSRDFWDLRKNCWWLLHLASIFFFFFIWKTRTVVSVRGMCGVCGSRLCSRHSKKRDPVYCYKRHIRKIKGGKYDLTDKQLYPAWHFYNPSRTHIPEILWVGL